MAVWAFAFSMEPLGALFGYHCAASLGLPRRQQRTIALECGVQNSSFTIAMILLSFGTGEDAEDALIFPLIYSLSFVVNSIWLVALFRFVVAPADALVGATENNHQGLVRAWKASALAKVSHKAWCAAVAPRPPTTTARDHACTHTHTHAHALTCKALL